jgi:hypothetical protein
VDRREAGHRRKDELIDLYHRLDLAPSRPLLGVIKQGPGRPPKTLLKQSKR